MDNTEYFIPCSGRYCKLTDMRLVASAFMKVVMAD